MIRLPCRTKGGAALLGAKGPGQTGPFGVYGADEDDQADEQHDGHTPNSGRRPAAGQPEGEPR